MDDKGLIKSILSLREWQDFDCKRVLAKPGKLIETIVAFANTDGGILAIGLEDPTKAVGDARLIGINEKPENAAELLHLIKTDISPALGDIRHFEIPIMNVLGKPDKLYVFNIHKSNDVHSLRSGDTFVRRGDKTVKIGSVEITRLKYEKGSIKFEDELSGVSDLECLDQDLLQSFRKDISSIETDMWQVLKDNGLAAGKDGNRQLVKGAILLFAKNPAVILKKKCSVKISHYHGNKPSFTGEPNFVRRPLTIEGPLLYQIQQTVKYFEDVVRSSPPKLKGASFTPSFMIPAWVFQEAVANAVIHRNYAVEDDIQVRFFSNRIEVESPGTYPGHITVLNIRKERFARNPMILRVLNRFANPPNLDIGEGVNRMFEVMREANLYEPLYVPVEHSPHSVLVVLWNMQKIEYWDVVSGYLDKNGSITNVQARKITGISDTLKMSRLLKEWVEKRLIEKMGSGKRSAVYVKPGHDISKSLFSQGIENRN